MATYDRYKIALEKAKMVEKMQISEEKKQEIYSNLGEWINYRSHLEKHPEKSRK